MLAVEGCLDACGVEIGMLFGGGFGVSALLGGSGLADLERDFAGAAFGVVATGFDGRGVALAGAVGVGATIVSGATGTAGVSSTLGGLYGLLDAPLVNTGGGGGGGGGIDDDDDATVAVSGFLI